jgi:pimeloyl-ACP methyl ester carboxylesterase
MMRAALCAVCASVAFASAAADDALPPPAARETLPGVDVVYTDVAVPNGDRVRLILTRPRGANGALPAVFVVGWLSCDSVSWPRGAPFGFAHLVHQIARESGTVTIRMEKPGVGDSRGPRCAELDFERELAAYRAAFAAVVRMAQVDARRVFLLGLSNGGGFAPLVAQETPVAGYVVVGGWVKTWYEHMLEHERRRLTLTGRAPADVNRAMAHYATLYERYLIEGLTPGAVVRQDPTLRADWYDADDGQYGRPARFFQQLQAQNLAQAWSSVRAPTFVVHGEYDWIMSADDHRIIADIVRRNGAQVTLVEAPRTNHVLEVLPDAHAALDGNGPYNVEVGSQIVRWVREQASQ